MYPDFINNKTTKYVDGRYHNYPPSEKRLEDRKAIFDIVKKNFCIIVTIDKIIDHFRMKYEGTHNWTGFSKKDRRKLFVERKGICHWCKKDLRFNEFTVEHLLPMVEGGDSSWNNLSIACAECNGGRDGTYITKEGFLKKEYRI